VPFAGLLLGLLGEEGLVAGSLLRQRAPTFSAEQVFLGGAYATIGAVHGTLSS